MIPSFSVYSSRSLVENAVQSCLLIPNLATKNAVEAWLLRARTRLVAGYALGAHKGSAPFSFSLLEQSMTRLLFACVANPIDIEAALMLDSENIEAKSLMSSLVPHARVVRILMRFFNRIRLTTGNSSPTQVLVSPTKYGFLSHPSWARTISRCCYLSPTSSPESPARYYSKRLIFTSVCFPRSPSILPTGGTDDNFCLGSRGQI